MFNLFYVRLLDYSILMMNYYAKSNFNCEKIRLGMFLMTSFFKHGLAYFIPVKKPFLFLKKNGFICPLANIPARIETF